MHLQNEFQQLTLCQTLVVSSYSPISIQTNLSYHPSFIECFKIVVFLHSLTIHYNKKNKVDDLRPLMVD